MLKQLQKSKSEGFTIIEVMIVLAIAGLILLIVFLAVPALQRNSRNTQIKNDASHLSGLISDWVGNNAGKSPATFKVAAAGVGDIDLTNENFAIMAAKPTAITALPSPVPAAPAADAVAVYSKAQCNGNDPEGATSPRSIVVVYGLEGSTDHGCVSAS
jgi:prepilin-type N-terminal cleavage/methylation domain-containing protein